MPKQLIAFVDLETSGLRPDFHEIIDTHIVLTDLEFNEIDRLQILSLPNYPERLTEGAQRVNGYNEEVWKKAGAVNQGTLADRLQSFFRKNVRPGMWVIPAGHRVLFDTDFLRATITRENVNYASQWPLDTRRFLDTLVIENLIGMAKVATGQQNINTPISLSSFDKIATAYGCNREGHHTAQQDIDDTIKVFKAQMAIIARGLLAMDGLDETAKTEISRPYPDMITFGAHKGVKIIDLPQSYLQWLIDKKVYTDVGGYPANQLAQTEKDRRIENDLWKYDDDIDDTRAKMIASAGPSK